MVQAEDAPLGYLLYRVGAVLRPEVSAVLNPLGLTLPEFVCLRILSMSPGLSSAELSRHVGVTPQAMNTVLRKLEDVGAVERPTSVSSGRALPATLTGQGRALLKRAEGAVRTADGRILSKLTAAQQREFKRTLDRLGSD
ncbi:MarR family transcriptional regulator [Mycobacterium heidelbergense]|uniref:MarR family transcriptional regulator n=1 Tax=Mycobacterium heidelbergense TaxID=53376 RepID=A0A1X0DTQ5_MYCHE|nr:MarR family transcriptional regulator [Mycobacterium heidelbergense]MCV7049105.1 MarR family transcriptional regulator [Mycobacterium heidelbergense]ORA75774.1 MarR family transcriptional regulator [Mycobacterium heidelbergense]